MGGGGLCVFFCLHITGIYSKFYKNLNIINIFSFLFKNKKIFSIMKCTMIFYILSLPHSQYICNMFLFFSLKIYIKCRISCNYWIKYCDMYTCNIQYSKQNYWYLIMSLHCNFHFPLLSANWTFSLWCVPLIKSGSRNWP